MLVDLQQALVDLFEAERAAHEADPELVAEGRLPPKKVAVYSGELLQPERLLLTIPALFVEFDDAVLESADDKGLYLEGDANLSALVCSKNAASGAAMRHDGVALLTWAYEAVRGKEIEVAGHLIHWERMTFRRLVNSPKLWAAALMIETKFV